LIDIKSRLINIITNILIYNFYTIAAVQVDHPFLIAKLLWWILYIKKDFQRYY